MEFRKRYIIGVLVILSIIGIPFFFGAAPPSQPFGLILDADYISSGPFSDHFIVTEETGATVIITAELEEVWRTEIAGPFCHESEFMPNGNIMITDTHMHRLIEVDVSQPDQIVWEWDASDSDDINWTAFGIQEGWSQEAIKYVSNQEPQEGDWTHMNDVEFINGTERGRTYDSLLVSMRNFDMIFEVNYTESKEILWYYGEPKNHTILFEQHNPDIRDNGNIIICDSGNHRIIEIDYETKEIQWDFYLDFPNGELRWARDCDDLGNGIYMITDSNNGRVLLVDRDTKTIIKEYGKGWLVQPYESDYFEKDGHAFIVTADPIITSLTLMDYETGEVINSIGAPFIANYVRYFGILVTFYFVTLFVVSYRNSPAEKKQDKLKDPNVYGDLINSLLVFFLVIFVATYFVYIAEFGIQDIIDSIVANQ
ncbi:MAG: aryl-sulfate sulfotransferase [Candidatus Thorarchaeota archaeon]